VSVSEGQPPGHALPRPAAPPMPSAGSVRAIMPPRISRQAGKGVGYSSTDRHASARFPSYPTFVFPLKDERADTVHKLEAESNKSPKHGRSCHSRCAATRCSSLIRPCGESQRGREPEGTDMSTLCPPRAWIEPVSARQDCNEGGTREGTRSRPYARCAEAPAAAATGAPLSRTQFEEGYAWYWLLR
jgi:hypothetical protein